jgi:hypothetical protein
MNTREGIQFAFHDMKVLHVEIVNFGNGFHFINIADGTDDMVLIGGEEILHSLTTEARRAAGDDYQFCSEESARNMTWYESELMVIIQEYQHRNACSTHSCHQSVLAS